MGKGIIFATLLMLSPTVLASSFVNVVDDQVIRANGGQVTIVVEGLGVLSINDEPIGVASYVGNENGLRTVYTIEVMDRGTHELTLTSEDGSVETITVHVQRVKRARK